MKQEDLSIKDCSPCCFATFYWKTSSFQKQIYSKYTWFSGKYSLKIKFRELQDDPFNLWQTKVLGMKICGILYGFLYQKHSCGCSCKKMTKPTRRRDETVSSLSARELCSCYPWESRCFQWTAGGVCGKNKWIKGMGRPNQQGAQPHLQQGIDYQIAAAQQV